MATTVKYYCVRCDRILEEEDGEIIQDAQGRYICPVCGERVCSEAEANKEFAKIEADLDNETAKNKQRTAR